MQVYKQGVEGSRSYQEEEEEEEEDNPSIAEIRPSVDNRQQKQRLEYTAASPPRIFFYYQVPRTHP